LITIIWLLGTRLDCSTLRVLWCGYTERIDMNRLLRAMEWIKPNGEIDYAEIATDIGIIIILVAIIVNLYGLVK